MNSDTPHNHRVKNEQTRLGKGLGKGRVRQRVRQRVRVGLRVRLRVRPRVRLRVALRVRLRVGLRVRSGLGSSSASGLGLQPCLVVEIAVVVVVVLAFVSWTSMSVCIGKRPTVQPVRQSAPPCWVMATLMLCLPAATAKHSPTIAAG